MAKMIYGNVLDILQNINSESIDLTITSPPYYGLRDYGVSGQWGLEETPQEYLDKMSVFMYEIYRITKPTGSAWINISDTYAGSGKGAWGEKHSSKETPETIPDKRFKLKEDVRRKSRLKIPERFSINCVFKLNWIERNDIIWFKRNAMPTSVQDRLKNTYEHIYFFTKNEDYYFDIDSIRKPMTTKQNPCKISDGGKQDTVPSKNHELYEGFNRRWNIQKEINKYGKVDNNRSRLTAFQNSVSGGNPKGKNPGDMWDITQKPFRGKHYATFPLDIPNMIIKCACPLDGVVLDPFMGSGTTAQAATLLKRDWIGIDLDERNKELIENRLRDKK